MRLTRFLLIVVFLAVAALFTVQDMASRFSDADEPPTLTCGDEVLDVSVAEDESVLLTGVTAVDPQDGDLSDKVLVTGVSRLMEGNTATVSYVVFDSDHNMATGTRQIHYTDYRLPRFVLDEPLIYGIYDDVQLLDRLHAQDVISGDITQGIRVTYADTLGQVGTHYIGVQVTNAMGDTAWLTVPMILVRDMEDQLVVELDTYLLYLKQGDRFDARRYLESASWQGDSVSLSNVTISGDVDTATPGTYYVEYTGVYGSHSGTVILTVVVE